MRATVVRVLGVCAWLTLLVAAILLVSRGHTFSIFDPAGQIAQKQRSLIYFTMLLSLVVVIPVFILTIFIGTRYRATNKKASYRPDWDSNKKLETLWWGIPLTLIVILSVVTWRTTHQLDPYRAITSTRQPLTVQVVALDWKWLFIYPDQGIAAVNVLHIPTDRPVNFQITSGGAMNSFWIPQLGGQVYAMSGMMSKLHLEADQPGTYKGVSANISGDGFADMKFDTIASSDNDFSYWVDTVRSGTEKLDETTLAELEKPSYDNVPFHYAKVSDELFKQRLLKTMGEGHN